MQINRINHSENENNSFGLFPGYLVYQNPETPKPSVQSKEKTTGIDALEKDREVIKEKIAKDITEYNKMAGDDFESMSEEEKAESRHLEKLETNPDKYEEIIKQIDRILLAPFKAKDDGGNERWYSFFNSYLPQKLTAQRTKLIKIRESLTDSPNIGGFEKPAPGFEINEDFLKAWNDLVKQYGLKNAEIPLSQTPRGNDKTLVAQYQLIIGRMETAIAGMDKTGEGYRTLVSMISTIGIKSQLISNPKRTPGQMAGGEWPNGVNPTYEQMIKVNREYKNKQAQGTGSFLVEAEKRLRDMEKTKAVWKTHSYDVLNASYDAVSQHPDFDDLRSLPVFGLSQREQRISKQLFFAILAGETDNFKTDFILKDFGDDPLENKKNYPFFYNAFLKERGVNAEQIKEQDDKIDFLESSLKSEQIPSAEKVILDSGYPIVNITKLNAIDDKYGTQKDSEYWNERKDELKDQEMNLRKQARKETDEGSAKSMDASAAMVAAKKLARHYEIAQQQEIRWNLLKGEKEAGADFTKHYLSENRHLLVRFAMQQFQKAKQIADQSVSGHADWASQYHATVRNMLIASIYETGVSRYVRNRETGKYEYAEDLEHEHHWLATQLATSRHFNRAEVGANMTDIHRNILIVGVMADKVSADLEYAKISCEAMGKGLDIKKKYKEGSEEEKKAFQELAETYPTAMVTKMMASNPEDLQKAYSTLKNETIPKKEEFLKRAGEAIQNPFIEESAEDPAKTVKITKKKRLNPAVKQFLDDVYGGAKYKDIISAEDMKTYVEKIKGVEYYYNTFDLDPRSRMDYLKELGVDIKGAAQSYLQLIQTKEFADMNVRNWDDYRTSKDKSKFDKLHKFLGAILAKSDPNGRSSFLNTFATLYNNNGGAETNPEKYNEQWAVLNAYTMIREEILEREIYAAKSEEEAKNIESKLKGVHLGDTISKYVSSIWDMTVGPGRSIAERAAGIAFFIAFYKLARKGMKANDNVGKLIAGAGLFFAGDIISKNMLGRGFMDMLGFDSIEGAIEGTYEAALVDFGAEKMKKEHDIEKHEHAQALYQMNKVPFEDLMKWYELTDDNGKPREGAPDIFPKKINVNELTKGVTYKDVDKPLRARKIVKKAMDNFFEYVAIQEKVDPTEAQKRLKERWIEMRRNRNYQPEHTDTIYHDLLDPYRANYQDLTWKIVTRAEIDIEDVKKTIDKNGYRPAWKKLESMGEDFLKWTREDIYHGAIKPKLDETLKGAGIYKDKIMDFLSGIGESGGRNLHFAKEKISVSWDNNQYEIKHFFGEVWGITIAGAKLPFELLYGGLKIGVPWTQSKINQIREVLRGNKLKTIDHDLKETDIMNTNLSSFEVFDTDSNPEFAYFGLYQKAFLAAFNKETDGENMYFKTPSFDEQARSRDKYPDNDIGYYITETTSEEAGLRPGTDIADNYDVMQKLSHDQAKKFYKNQTNLTGTEIDYLMYPIHVYSKPGKDINVPAALYTFWRMPLPGSEEYQLKKQGRWADYPNPNDIKDRMPFYVDPHLDVLDNLKRALTLNVGATRKAGGVLGKVAIQPLHFALAVLGETGDLAQGLAKWMQRRKKGKGKPQTIPWLESITKPLTEDSMQKLDELSTTADMGAPAALSEFYKDKNHYRTYKLLLDYAHQFQQEAPYLDLLTSERDYKGTQYLTKPKEFNYTDLQGFYDVWQKKNGGEIPGLKAKIEQKAAEENLATSQP
jgi:hypothetical protein